VAAGPFRGGPGDGLYDLLFADEPERFRASEGAVHPALAEPPDVPALVALAADATAESRARALAYRRLAEVAPDRPPMPLPLLGVIVEIGLDEGLDALAAYADGRVRYLNHAGPVSIWEGDPTIRPEVDGLLAAAGPVAAAIGPWQGPRRPPPGPGILRLTFLVGAEIRFGEGPIATLAADRMGGPVFAAATRLLQAVARADAG